MMLVAQQPESGLILVAVIIVGVLLVALAIGYGVKLTQQRDATLRELARKLGGQLQTGNFVSFPELRLPHEGRTVTFGYTAGGENESTKSHLAIPWPSGRLRCEIFLEGPFSGLRKLIGMQDIEIGSPHFDRQFIITGNDEAAIKAFLTPDAQARVLDLLKLESSGMYSVPNFYLRIGGGTLTVTKASYFTDARTIQRFIDLFVQFFDAASGVPAAGIEFLDSPKTSTEATPHCIVCGEALTSDLVTCRSCRTPHHRECWQYFGGCATYACGGKQHMPAKGGGL